MKLSQYIKEKRLEKNMTQVELAKKLGMSSAQHLCNIENGSAPMPSKYYRKLCSVLRITKDELVDIMVDEYELLVRSWL